MPTSPLVSKASRFLPWLIPLAVLLLYLPFIHNPLVFDDQYFFMPGNPAHYVEQGLQFTPRWLAYFSHALTFVWLGDAVVWQRAGNLVIHALCGLALCAFMSCLMRDLGPAPPDRTAIRRSAALAAALFVLHPAAVFAAGYLIQRTTLLATLFCLCSWTLFWLGLKGNRLALWASLPAFALAAWSKEHCVMAPAVNACLLIAHLRSPSASRVQWRDTLMVLCGQFAISALLVAFAARWIGTPYELSAATLIDQSVAGTSGTPASAHQLSIVTQCGLFFKYLALWVLPDGTRMSIDMREHFATSATSAQAILAMIAFVAWGMSGFLALLKGRTWSLIGIALLAPWLMFGTEIAALRIQEIFVLYRSYLWVGPFFLLPALLLSRPSARLAGVFSPLLLLMCGAFAANKLHTMSSPLMVWQDSTELYERQTPDPSGQRGAARMYHNLGLELLRTGFVEASLSKLDRALELNPDYPEALGDRAAALLANNQPEEALVSFDQALLRLPGAPNLHAGRAEALYRLGRHDESALSERKACEIGGDPYCMAPKRKSPLPDREEAIHN